ncbi:MAG: glutathione S-transferase [Sphingomonas sanxanigenens]|uniref:Glutathione S-transferase n=1 Tax=Sphingomonas sanxanigenens TaxID=397260 RepID=A0A2W5AGH3_9SPHN|nr:MAG: glutathione S-transferase [Sphingomonas sanxanigenens]
MILYGSSLSPFVRKTMIAGAEKGIAFEHKQLPPGADDPGFCAASPFGKIPALSDGDFDICDSTAILTYWEALHPETPLLPAEPRARARTIWYEEFGDTILIGATLPIFFNMFVARMVGREPDMAAADKARTETLPPVLDYIESVMPESGHLIEDRLTIADIAVICPLQNASYCGVAIDDPARPKLAHFFTSMNARPSIAPIIAANRKMLHLTE